jgi:hypothetical protein
MENKQTKMNKRYYLTCSGLGKAIAKGMTEEKAYLEQKGAKDHLVNELNNVLTNHDEGDIMMGGSAEGQPKRANAGLRHLSKQYT